MVSSGTEEELNRLSSEEVAPTLQQSSQDELATPGSTNVKTRTGYGSRMRAKLVQRRGKKAAKKKKKR